MPAFKVAARARRVIPSVGLCTTKNLTKLKLTDWSDYDFFQCWIYVDTSRESLPGSPLSMGFTHPGHKVTTNLTLKEVKKDQWVKIVVPIAKLLDPKEVLAVRFNIAESNYRHGDRVDFYISDMVLTRYVDPTVAELDTQRKALYPSLHPHRQLRDHGPSGSGDGPDAVGRRSGRLDHACWWLRRKRPPYGGASWP